MKMFKRFLSLSLCLLMLIPLLIACNMGNEGDNGETTTPSDDVIETEQPTESETERVFQYDENGYVKDELPDTTYDGRKVYIIGWKGNERYTLPVDSGNNTVQLYSKIYYNRLAVEARLDVQFDVKYIESHGNGGMQPGIVNELEILLSSGDTKYDLVQGYSLYPAVMAQRGLLYNINNLQYPDMDMPWWPDEIANWNQYGGLYYLANGSSTMGLRSMFVLFSNTEMITAENLTDPVELVIEGKWNIEKMMEYAKAFSGMALANPGEMYGFVVDDFSRMDAYYYGAGFQSTVNDANDVATIALSDPSYRSRVSDYADTLVDFFKRPEVEIALNTTVLMKEKKTAMMSAYMSAIEGMPDNSYAALPIPKIDEDARHYTMQTNGYDMWAIPKNSTQPELAGIVIEAIASSEYRNVAPYYFETVLKDRYAQDTKGMQVFDIIRESVVYDFGRSCQFAFTKGTVEGLWRNCFNTNRLKDPKNNLESEWAIKGELMEIALMEIQRNLRNNSRNS